MDYSRYETGSEIVLTDSISCVGQNFYQRYFALLSFITLTNSLKLYQDVMVYIYIKILCIIFFIFHDNYIFNYFLMSY